MQLRRIVLLAGVIFFVSLACSGPEREPGGQLLATLEASVDQEVEITAMTAMMIHSHDGTLELCAYNEPGDFTPPWGFWAIAKASEVESGKTYMVSGTLRKGAPELEGFGAGPQEGSYFIENAVVAPAAE